MKNVTKPTGKFDDEFTKNNQKYGELSEEENFRFETELLARISESICLAIRQINKPVDDDCNVLYVLNSALRDCQHMLDKYIGYL